MRVQLRLSCSVAALKVAMAGAAALLLAGCSSEMTRLAGDGRSDLTPTATIPQMPGTQSRLPVMPGGSGVNGLGVQGAAATAVASKALPGRGSLGAGALGAGALGAGALGGSAIQSKALAPVQNKALAPVVSQSLATKANVTPRPAYTAPVTPSPQASLRAPPSSPATTGSISKPTSSNGWTAEGGTPIVVAQGETVAMLGSRYGVPTDALLRTNGFTSAAQVQPGARIVVPVYSGTSRPATAQAKPMSTPQAKPIATVRADTADKVEKPVKQAEQPKPKEKLQFSKGPEPVVKTKPVAVAKAPEAKPVKTVEAKPVKTVEAKPVKTVEAKPVKTVEAKPVKSVETKPAKPEKPAKAIEIARVEKPVKPEKTAQAEKPAKPVETAKVDPKPEKPTKQQIAEAKAAKKPEAAKAPQNVDRETTTATVDPGSSNVSDASDKPEFRWPARGRVIQGFKPGANDGINIALPEGTSVKAAEGGTVAYAGSELKGYGNMVLIRHPNGYVSAYANNGEIAVKRGDKVTRGQTIAKSGQTGNVATPQLHFELRKGSTPVDPTGYLAGL